MGLYKGAENMIKPINTLEDVARAKRQAADRMVANADAKRALAITDLRVARALRDANPNDPVFARDAEKALARAAKAAADHETAQRAAALID